MFTVEEITLLDSYKKNTKILTINEIKANYKYQDDTDIISLIDSLLSKLKKMSEDDFKNIDFSNSLLDEVDSENH